MPGKSAPCTVITGGSGFVGSHLCDRLIAEGHVVVCLDNMLTGTPTNVEHLLDHDRFTLVRHDVTEPIFLDQLLDDSDVRPGDLRVDNILHFASPASPKDYARHPIHTLKVGALGTLHTLGLARAHESRYLLASTSEVYGDPEVSPQPESYRGNVSPTGPRSVYDEAKRFAEALASAYHHTHGLDVRIARLFNTYGPRMRLDDGRAVPTFVTQAIRNEPLTVYGDGSQTRSLCYVDDTVEGIYRLLTVDPRAPSSSESGQGDLLVVNIGNPEEVSVLQMAREIIDAAGSRSTVAFRPLPTDDPKVRRPDTTRAKELLSWQAKVSRAEGFIRIVPYFQTALRTGVSSGA